MIINYRKEIISLDIVPNVIVIVNTTFNKEKSQKNKKIITKNILIFTFFLNLDIDLDLD